MFNDAVLAEYVRDGFVESEHRGFLAMLNSDGSLYKSLGDIDTQIFRAPQLNAHKHQRWCAMVCS
jgi:L-asparaginase II